MKKNKIILISLIGLLIIAPFMTNTKAQPPSYVGVAEEEKYDWDLNIYVNKWIQWFADDMTNTLASLWFHVIGADDLTTVYDHWSWDMSPPQSIWPLTVDTILPEETGKLLSVYDINDTITATPVDCSFGFEMPDYPLGNTYYPLSVLIGNDTSTFAKQSLYGGMVTTPYWIMGISFAPKNIDWTEFVSEVQSELGTYWGGGWVSNTTIAEITDGFSMFVPAYAYENNTESITITTTYDTNGILTYHSFEYGSNMLYDYVHSSFDPDVKDPVITDAPSDFAVPHDYTGQNITWTATDANPAIYSITRNGVPVAGPTPWTSGIEVTYNITDGLAPSSYTYEITFFDGSMQSAIDTVVMTVQSETIIDTTDPVITDSPSDLTVETGYVMASLSWTATDENPNTYTIELQGTGVVAGPSSWSSGVAIPFIIPIDLEAGEYTYTINITDDSGNFVTDSVIFTVQAPEEGDEEAIPGYELPIVLGVFTIASIGLIVLMKKKNKW